MYSFASTIFIWCQRRHIDMQPAHFCFNIGPSIAMLALHLNNVPCLLGTYFVRLDTKWQIHPFISKGTSYLAIPTFSMSMIIIILLVYGIQSLFYWVHTSRGHVISFSFSLARRWWIIVLTSVAMWRPRAVAAESARHQPAWGSQR